VHVGSSFVERLFCLVLQEVLDSPSWLRRTRRQEVFSSLSADEVCDALEGYSDTFPKSQVVDVVVLIRLAEGLNSLELRELQLLLDLVRG